jgi:hypothetical protein
MSVVKTVGIHFGALSDPLAKQLTDQLLKFSPKEVKFFQQDMDALMTLRIRYSLPESMTDKIMGKIHKKIVAHVAKAEKMNIVAHTKKSMP